MDWCLMQGVFPLYILCLLDDQDKVLTDDDSIEFSSILFTFGVSLTACLAPSLQSGLPYVEVLCKNRYVGRTFIQPNTRLRQLGVAKKFGALTDNFAGKRIVLIDDSIVRGNTISPIIKLLKEAGATEVGSTSAY